MNAIFLFIVLISFAFAGWRQFFWDQAAAQISPMQELTKAMLESAAGSVDLAIGLVGIMALFLGLMKVAEKGGMLKIIAMLIRPLMIRLFPQIPPEHPAMGAMILNISANAMGLGNAATPFGIRAMQELDKLNPTPGTATDSMALFLAINTSSVTLLPTGVIALRAAAGSNDPAGILPTTLFATLCSTTVAIFATKFYARILSRRRGEVSTYKRDKGLFCLKGDKNDGMEGYEAYPIWLSVLALGMLACLIPVTIVFGEQLSPWIIPGLMAGFLVFGILKKVAVYETFVEGAKEGFQVAIKIIPYLVAILVAVGMLRASGAMGCMVDSIGGFTRHIGIPAEALPMAVLRPLSGSGAYGLLASIINDPSIGPDSYVGYLVSTLQGSTETTFYVLAVYYGSIQVKRIRHTLAAGITGDVAGVMGAVAACLFLYG